MKEIGFDVTLTLDLAGFYPRGAGRIRALIRPGNTFSSLTLTERGPLKRIQGVSAVANLDLSIAERQRHRALERLAARCHRVEIETLQLPSKFKGTMLLLVGEFENSRCCYYSLGERGKPAERIADEAVDQLEGFLVTDGAIDQYLADQLLLPLAFAFTVSELRTSKVTQHLLTNSEIIKAFLPVDLEINGRVNQPGLIRIGGGGLSREQSGR
jgi:RNA 3'-terminal phosphate cyclase (ATP)